MLVPVLFFLALAASVIALIAIPFARGRRKRMALISLGSFVVSAVLLGIGIATYDPDRTPVAEAPPAIETVPEPEAPAEVAEAVEPVEEAAPETPRRPEIDLVELEAALAALAEAQAEEEDHCRWDERCYADEGSLSAERPCKDRVERLAVNTAQWTMGRWERAFTRFVVEDLEAGVVVYVGDSVRFQNDFGAWQPHIYFCRFNLETRQVLDVWAERGRLD